MGTHAPQAVVLNKCFNCTAPYAYNERAVIGYRLRLTFATQSLRHVQQAIRYPACYHAHVFLLPNMMALYAQVGRNAMPGLTCRGL